MLQDESSRIQGSDRTWSAHKLIVDVVESCRGGRSWSRAESVRGPSQPPHSTSCLQGASGKAFSPEMLRLANALLPTPTTVTMSDPNPGQLKRNQTFSPKREPLSGSASLRRHVSRTTGPFSFLNPTRAYYSHVDLNKDEESAPGSEDPDANGEGEDTNRGTQDLKIPPHERAADKVQYVWSSRNNRKGRHQLEVTPAADPTSAKYLVPDRTNSLRAILQNIGRMFTKYPVWDVSWLVAYIFTWGSIVWVINALYVELNASYIFLLSGYH